MQDLKQYYDTIIQRLNIIWDQIGFEESIRIANMNELFKKLQKDCEEKIREEESVREVFLKSLNTNIQKLRTLSKKMGKKETKVEEFIQNNSGSEFTLKESSFKMAEAAEKIEKVNNFVFNLIF